MRYILDVEKAGEGSQFDFFVFGEIEQNGETLYSFSRGYTDQCPDHTAREAIYDMLNECPPTLEDKDTFIVDDESDDDESDDDESEDEVLPYHQGRADYMAGLKFGENCPEGEEVDYAAGWTDAAADE